MTMTKIVLLDRDGVINYDSEKYVKQIDEWRVIPDSLVAIANLTQAGYKVVVCSNQSGIGRGLFTMEKLNSIHDKMYNMVEQAGGKIAAICFCPHKPEDNCTCRKPQPRLILDICNRFNINDMRQVMLVGDSLRDLEAIASAGGIPILVKTGKGKKTIAKEKLPKNTKVFDNLLKASEYILSLNTEK